MEFRYRAIDTDRPPPATDTAPTQSSKPNLSFLSEQSMPGSSEVNVQEVIQREIEKEQIRQEIIIAEATRKRELIAEVLQEMAIEREMAKRGAAETGMSLEEKLIMLINQKKLPNQIQNNSLFRQMYTGAYNSLVTSPMMQLPQLHNVNEATGTSVLESNKEKLIVLERADSIGSKRKAEDTQTGLNEHLQGKKQKSREAKTTSLESGEIVSSKLPCSGKLSKLRRSFKFWCEICKVGAFNQTVMRNHELGKKHMTAVTQQNEAVSSSLAPTSVAAQKSEAIAVGKDVNPEGQEVDEMLGKKTESEKKKNATTVWCQLCNVLTNSEQMMESHRLGKKHMALVKKQQNKPHIGLDTKLITVPVRSVDTDSGEKGKVHGLNKS